MPVAVAAAVVVAATAIVSADLGTALYCFHYYYCIDWLYLAILDTLVVADYTGDIVGLWQNLDDV